MYVIENMITQIVNSLQLTLLPLQHILKCESESLGCGYVVSDRKDKNSQTAQYTCNAQYSQFT